jgi:hypothetical protein
MADIIRLEMPALAAKIQSVRHYDGLPINAREISDMILDREGLPPTDPMTTPAERAGEKKAVEGVTR